VLLASVLALPAGAQQQDFSQVQIGTVPVADGLYMLTGSGGNIGVAVGPDGVIVVDDQFAELVGKIRAAVRELSAEPIRMVLNTHWHFDHTGGNELLAEAGAVVIAHENVRRRMSTRQFMEFFQTERPPSPAGALPVVTFTRDLTLHLNGMTVEVQHVPPAHTDGDAIVWFADRNAVHMGDTYFNGFYPFIDVSSGGNIAGMLAAVEGALARMDAQTKVIPGHGPLSNAEELSAYRDMLRAVTARMQALIDEGLDADAVVAAKPTAEFDGRWGQGFIQPDDWVRLVYQSLAAR
jgi:glyoxylase-like metal-dependent hydrolase (beta-lactamase superfamily II)